jgi:putative acetyltransferase
MKIQRVTPDNQAKAYALLRRAFPGSDDEARLVEQLHAHGKPVHDWICLHTGKAIAYIAFSNAYHGKDVCGLHLAPMAVAPDFQKQGIGRELLQFALRQEPIKSQPLFVLGAPGFYQKFGFTPCRQPICPFAKNNAHFLCLRHEPGAAFTIGYEPEFHPATKPAKPQGKKRR